MLSGEGISFVSSEMASPLLATVYRPEAKLCIGAYIESFLKLSLDGRIESKQQRAALISSDRWCRVRVLADMPSKTSTLSGTATGGSSRQRASQGAGTSSAGDSTPAEETGRAKGPEASRTHVQGVAEDGSVYLSSVKSLVPAALDPRKLRPWKESLDKAFSRQFPLSEVLGLPFEIPSDPNQEVRAVLARIAGSANPNSPEHCRLFVIQSLAPKTSVLIVTQRVLAEDDDTPVIECLWYHNTLAALEADDGLRSRFFDATRILQAPDVGGVVAGEVECTAGGVELLRILLSKNRARLDPDYVKSREALLHQDINCSVLSPIPSVLPKVQKCARCGVVAEKLKRCGQCLAVTYCGADCQKIHWKAAHKAECQAAPPKDCAEVAISRTGMEYEDLGIDIPPEWANKLISLNRSGVGNNNETLLAESTDSPGQVPSHLLGAQLIVKVQVPMTALSGAPCVVYDKKREIQITLSPNNCHQHREICQAISQHGVYGLKAYYRAWIPATADGNMKIAYRSPLPAQEW
jgi:hypothetical protein